MATPLSSDEHRKYMAIIDGILATANLETISRKKIRQGLEMALGGKDLSDQKHAIKELIEERFDKVSGADVAETVESTPSQTLKRAANGTSDHVDTDGSATPEPAAKKMKRSESVEDADAKLAAQLQAQENSLARGRTTRGGGDKGKATKKRKAPRKKSAKRVNEDSDAGSDGSAPAKRKAGGGFQKPFTLSTPLSDLVGETQLSRPQVVKKLWEHIKANDLQDPRDKRQIRCDEKMLAIFRQPKVDMFKMNKEIGNHLYPIEE